jgi:hypothetical protein
MASIRKEIVIEAPPEQVWEAVLDVGAVHRSFVPGHVVGTRIEGDTGILSLEGGDVVRELIVAVDDEARRLAHAVVECLPKVTVSAGSSGSPITCRTSWLLRSAHVWSGVRLR